MSAYEGMTRRVRDALITIINGITYDAGNGAEPAFGLVTADPAKETDQEPYCLVASAPSKDVKGPVGQNDRTLSYSAFIELKLEGTTRTQLQTVDYMSDLTDLVVDTLDVADFTGQLNTVDPSIQNWLLDVSKSSFYKAQKSKGGVVCLCIISIDVKYTHDL